MPIYRVEGPDGRIHRFEGPPDATPDEVEAFAAQQFGQPKKRGFGAAVSKGFEDVLSSGQTALGSLFGDANEAARQALARSEAQQNKYEEQVGTERVKKAYGEKGVLGAAKEVARQVPLALGEQAPQLGASLGSAFAGARLGAMALTPFAGPVGTAVGGTIGGLIGIALPSLVQQYGGDIERQAAEQQKAGKPIDIQTGRAAAAAIPQAALDVVETRLLFGTRILGKLFGTTAETVAKLPVAEAEKLAKDGLTKTLLKGTAKGAALEIPTEVTQTMLERWQAGLPLTTPDAIAEYGETAYQTGLLGPLGIPGQFAARSAAREQITPAAVTPTETPPIAAPTEVAPAAPTAPLPSTPEIDAMQAEYDERQAKIDAEKAKGAQGNKFAIRNREKANARLLAKIEEARAGIPAEVTPEAAPAETVTPEAVTPETVTTETVTTEAAPAQPGVITDDVLKSLEIKGYGQKKLKDAIRGLDLNTDEGKTAFAAAFETAPKGVRYNSAAVEALSPTVKVEEPALELRTPIQPESGQPARSDAVSVPAGATAVTPTEVVGTPGVGSDIGTPTGVAEGEKPVSTPLIPSKITFAEPSTPDAMYVPEAKMRDKDAEFFATGNRQGVVFDTPRPSTGTLRVNSIEANQNGIKFNTTSDNYGPTKVLVDPKYIEIDNVDAGKFVRFSKDERAQENVVRAAIGDAAVDAFLAGGTDVTERTATAFVGQDFGPQFQKIAEAFSDHYSGAVPAVAAAVTPATTLVTKPQTQAEQPQAGAAPRIAPESQKTAAETLAVKDAPKAVQEYVQFYGDMDTALKALGFDLYEDIPAGENFKQQGGRYAKQFGQWIEANGTPEQKATLAKNVEIAKRNKTAGKAFYEKWTKQQKAKKALEADLEQAQREEFESTRKTTAKQRAEDRAGEAELIELDDEVDRDEARRAAMRFSTGEKTGRTENTITDVREELQREFSDKKGFDNLVTVVQSEKDLPRRVLDYAEYGEAIRGVVYEGRIWLVADNIPRGQELSVALHEIGAHVGFDRFLTKKDRQQLSDQVRTWSKENDMRGEAARIALAKGKESNDEIIAYMTEELVNRGVRPVSMRPASKWLQRIFDKFKAYLTKLGIGKVTEQDLVDMAYGAAHLAIRLPINVQYGKPRFSVSNPGLAAALATANKNFGGPSAPKSIIANAIDSVTSPNRMKRAGNTIDKIRQNMANKNTWWEDLFSTLKGNNALDAMGAASAIDRLQASTKTSGISAAALEMGGFRKNEKTGLWEAYKTDASYKDIIETIQSMVGKYAETPTFEAAERLFNFAATARREQGLIDSKQLTTQGGDITPTLDAQQLKDGLAAYNSTPEIQKALELFDKLNDRNIDQAVAAGWLDPAEAKRFKGNAGYVPWFRFSEDADGNIRIPSPKEFAKGLTNRSNIKDLEGASVDDVQINNILDNMSKLNNWIVNKSIGNDTAKYLVDFAEAHGQAKPVGAPTAKGVDPQRVAQVMVGGKPKYWEMSDPAALAAFKGYESAHWSITPLLAMSANLVRRGTTLFPIFSLSQLPQDSIRAFVASGLKNPYAIFPRVLANFTKELFGTSSTAQRLKQFGIVGRGSDIAPGEAKGSFRRKLGYYDAGLGGNFNRGIDILERISAASDEAVRTALYELTMEETGNEVLALRRAREIINFDTMGSSAYASFLRQTVPFMGVYMNDLNNLYKGLVLGSARLSEGQKKETKQAIVYRGMQLAMLTMLYTLMVGDDDDYKKLNDNTRNRSFIIPGTNVRIPVPNDGIGFLFKVLPEQITRMVLAEGIEGEDAGAKFGRAVAGAFWDLGSLENWVPGVGSPVGKTFAELTLNRSFFTQNPIVGKSKEGLMPAQQYTESTSEMAKNIGEALNLSPLKVDHVVRALGGQIGGSVMSMSNALFHAADGKVTPSLRYEDISAFKAFSYSSQDKDVKDDYYELRSRVDMVARTYNDLAKLGRGEELRELLSDPENVRALALRSVQTEIDGNLSKLRQARKLVLENQNIDSDEMRRRLDRIDEVEAKYLNAMRLPKLRAFAGVTPDVLPNFAKMFK